MQKKHQTDYRPWVSASVSTRFLQDSRVEVVRDVDLKNPPRCAVFDFDGTLSLIRQGWPNVMVPMMVEALKETGDF